LQYNYAFTGRAKQTQFAGCSNELNLSPNKGLRKSATLQPRPKQTQSNPICSELAEPIPNLCTKNLQKTITLIVTRFLRMAQKIGPFFLILLFFNNLQPPIFDYFSKNYENLSLISRFLLYKDLHPLSFTKNVTRVSSPKSKANPLNISIPYNNIPVVSSKTKADFNAISATYNTTPIFNPKTKLFSPRPPIYDISDPVSNKPMIVLTSNL